MRRFALALALTACTSSAPDDVVGPFTGTTHRFVVDSITMPVNPAKARELAADLDGDGEIENEVGLLTTMLGTSEVLNLHAREMIRAGMLASVVEIVAHDLAEDPAAGVFYHAADGDTPTPVGGAFSNGMFTSNRTSTTRAPGKARVRLPVFAASDPSEIELVGMEMELVPDGQGGYHAHVAGGVRVDEALAVAHDGTRQLLASDPQAHRALWWLVDTNHDGVLTGTESRFLADLLRPDVVIWFDGDERPAVSIGFAVHLRPCPEGTCIAEPIGDTCVDRRLDGDETDLDCGGSCGIRCQGGQGCRGDADCQSGTCGPDGRCGSPACDNGRLDGFEASIDCGGGCAGCAFSSRCEYDEDCASGACGDNGVCY